MKGRKTIGIVMLSLAMVSTHWVPAANAASESLNPIILSTDDGALASQPGAAQLLAKAEANGTVPVIAVLAVAMSDQATISARQAAVEAAALDRARDGFLARVLGGNTAGANVKRFDIVPYVALTVTPAQLRRLLSDPAVIAVQEDVAVPPTLDQSIPIINANDVWNLGFRGLGRTVAILDTGVQKTHPMFAGVGKIISEACYSTTGSGTTSVCPPGSITAAGSGVNCPLNISGCDHGTHVASIAAGLKATTPAKRGTAFQARIIAIQVFSRFNSAASCSPSRAPCARTFASDQILALQRVFSLRTSIGNIDSVNMSLGGGSFALPCFSDLRRPVIAQLRSAGIATVIAAGNSGFNGSIGAPACVPGAIAVGSSTKTDTTISSFSNHSAYVHLLAPGDNISAAKAGGVFGSKSGTSMAAPHVAGALVLLRQIKPNASVSKLLSALACTGKLLGRNTIHRPRIDLLAARTELLAADPAESFPFTSTAAGWFQVLRTWSRFTNGELGSTNINGWALASHDYCSSAFRVTARVEHENPSATNFDAGIVLASQLVTPSSSNFVSGFFFAFNKGTGAGNATVWSLDNFNFTTDTGGKRKVCNKDKATGAGFHIIRVDVTNDLYRFFLDGTAICTLTNSSYPPKKVLLAAEGPDSGTGNNIFFDSIDIVPLTATSRSGAETASPVALGPRVRVGG